MPRKKIDSWEQLQKQIKSIIAKVNADQSMALAAALNPLFAVEELGYEISPEARPSIEDRIRFDRQTAKRSQDLRESIFRQVGHFFDLNSPEQMSKVLFEELKLRPAPAGKREVVDQHSYARVPPTLDTKPLPHKREGAEPAPDPLEVLRDAHPVMEPLLEYRRLQASRPLLAPRDAYDAVRQGKVRLPIQEIRARLKGTGNQ